EDGIRDKLVTGVQTCALPISEVLPKRVPGTFLSRVWESRMLARGELSEASVRIPPSGVIGDLTLPINARGVVIFAHGSGSSRLSSRNRFVASVLQRSKLATLLLDLLTAEEEQI